MENKVFIGIDLSVVKSKRPSVLFMSEDLKPISVAGIKHKPPLGIGNAGCLDTNVVSGYVRGIVDYIKQVQDILQLQIGKIAIDSPSMYRSSNVAIRSSEKELMSDGYTLYKTPTKAELSAAVKKLQAEVSKFGSIQSPYYSNLLWIIPGIQLFKELGKTYTCIETFPNAIVKQLDKNIGHKSNTEELYKQIGLFCKYLNIDKEELQRDLQTACVGSLHDRFDAYLCAWAASLPTEKIKIYGAENDTIHIPVIK